MRPGSGFLNARQRGCAWFGFFLLALQAPLAARLVDDASWLFSLCVAGMIATVLVADDTARRARPVRARRGPK